MLLRKSKISSLLDSCAAVEVKHLILAPCFPWQAFRDVERDMTQQETPMDRLICGDVGFGKTEVALRAVFRAVASGRQAMVMAPTTVLAKQHFAVIKDRFATYPQIEIALLTRFQVECAI